MKEERNLAVKQCLLAKVADRSLVVVGHCWLLLAYVAVIVLCWCRKASVGLCWPSVSGLVANW